MKITLKYWFLFVFVASTCIRLFFNFSQELIPGVNGGYYPLQVRYILSNGYMGFSDMPLLFYVDAFLIKFISFLGVSLTDTLILNVVKIVDSISLPLLLLPLFNIIQLEGSKVSKMMVMSVTSFAVLSFSPLILTSDLQKNALSITFLFCFIAYLLSYLNNKKKVDIILSMLFLFLTGLSHFGTAVIAILFSVLLIGYVYKRKAIVPLSLLIITSLIVVFVFDVSRFNRLFSIYFDVY